MAFICIFLAWLGIRTLDALTPHIHKRQLIGESPIATGLFIAGFFILVGLVIHGAATAQTAIGGSIVGYIFDFRAWGLLALSFLVSLLVGIVLFHLIRFYLCSKARILLDEEYSTVKEHLSLSGWAISHQ
ncbi:hypothetical protein ACFLV0_06865 [Chloroflexota bacterium]